MSLSRKHTPASFVLLPALFLSLAQPAMGLSVTEGAPAAPRAAERQIPLAWNTTGEVRMQTVAAAWQPVATVQFLPAANDTGAANQDAAALRTGPLSWTVTPAGTHVLDNRTGATATIPDLTSADVRPHDIVYDKQAGSVWFYGEDLYRYQIASHTLERMRRSDAGWQAIRKIARGQAGLWLAAGSGIYLLDAADGALKRIHHPATDDVRVINLAVGGSVAWFATADARLIRVGMPVSGRFALTVSPELPGVPAELAVSGQTVWMLLGDQHGDYYRLAYVSERQDQLGILAGKYFSLTENGGQLTAGAYATQFTIDPATKIATPVRAAEGGLLAGAARNQAVLYAGSSYGYKDGCEVVEHGQLDISKGWTTAMGEPFVR